MSKYCVECGAGLGPNVRFCAECGVPVRDREPRPSDNNTTELLSPTTQVDAAPRGRNRRVGTVGAAVAVLASVAILTGLAVNSQAANTDPAADAAAIDASEASADAAERSERRLMKAKIKAKAEAEAEAKAAEEAAAAQAAAAPPEQPEPPAAPAPSSTGSWVGTMADGKYEFALELTESGGDVYGSMYQYSNEDRDSGTEQVSGYRSGNTLYLQGTSWSKDAPNNWGLDDFTIELGSDGETLWGTYTCDVCSTSNELQGSRGYGAY